MRKATLKMPTRIIWGTVGKDVLNGKAAKELRKRLYELQPEAVALVEKVEELRNTYSFGATNLKLHDVSYELYSNADKYEEKYGVGEQALDQAFNWFCESEYWMFEELEKEEGWRREYVGRTSSFYFTTDNSNSDALEPFYDCNWRYEYTTGDVLGALENRWIGSDMGETIERLAENDLTLREFHEMHKAYWSTFIEDLDDGDISENIDELENVICELNSVVDDFKEELDRIQAAYDWLEDYKANQVAYFREWFEQEMLERPELYLDEEGIA